MELDVQATERTELLREAGASADPSTTGRGAADGRAAELATATVHLKDSGAAPDGQVASSTVWTTYTHPPLAEWLFAARTLA